MGLSRTIFTQAAAGIAAIGLSIGAQAAVLVGVTGEFYDFSGPVTSVTDAETMIAASSGPDATWTVSGIDYPNGAASNVNDATLLSSFLGADSATLSADFTNLSTSAMRFVGQILLDGSETSFEVGSDDGFVLRIGGSEISRFETQRSFSTTFAANPLSPGLYTFELIYFENGGDTGIEFGVDGNIVAAGAAPVPLPGAAFFMITGLAGVFSRYRQRA